MISLSDAIKSKVPSPCYERPFVCDGFPSSSSLIVIGENPATPMPQDWWSFWSDAKGFQYRKFIEFYMAERISRGKNRTSPTRLRLDRIRLNGVSAVETNTFRNEKPDGAGKGSPNYEVLTLLVENMQNLKAIIAHGKIAGEYLEHARIPHKIKKIVTPHFKFVSYEKIDQICNEIGA